MSAHHLFVFEFTVVDAFNEFIGWVEFFTTMATRTAIARIVEQDAVKQICCRARYPSMQAR